MTNEQELFIKEFQTKYPSDIIEFRIFSGDVYVRYLGPLADLCVLACDPDGKERIDDWPSRGVTIEHAEAIEAVIREVLGELS